MPFNYFQTVLTIFFREVSINLFILILYKQALYVVFILMENMQFSKKKTI